MRPPRMDALQVLLVEIARPPGDFRHVMGEIDPMLAGATAGLDHVAGFAGQELLQHRPDRLMVAVERRRVETAVGFDRPAVLAKFHHILSHDSLPDLPKLTSFKPRSQEPQNLTDLRYYSGIFGLSRAR